MSYSQTRRCPQCGNVPKRWRNGVCANCRKHNIAEEKAAGAYVPAVPGPKPTERPKSAWFQFRTISLTQQQAERFWSYVEKTEGGCWNWQRPLDNGYGNFYIGKLGVRAHRVAYTLVKGTLPDDKVIDHLCRNRACVNPEHLELVTVQINTLRGVGPSAQAALVTHCPQGHPYDEQNTWLETRQGRKPKRHCRKCNKRRSQDRRAGLTGSKGGNA